MIIIIIITIIIIIIITIIIIIIIIIIITIIIIIIITIIIIIITTNPVFQEVTHLTGLSSTSASNNRKQNMRSPCIVFAHSYNVGIQSFLFR